jgi:SAM-dependent methyltransferase
MEKRQYDELKAQQNIHWWFTGKREIVIDVAKTYLGFEKGNDKKILDVGCGMGLMLDALQEYGTVYGLDMEEEAVEYCNQVLAEQGKAPNVVIGSLPDHVPFQEGMFDYIFALDIIEHVKNDTAALNKLYSLLKEDGKLLITVPALMSMWSYNDELNHHYRRYEKDELLEKLNGSGLKVIKFSFYNSYLYPFAWTVRKIKRLLSIKSSDVADETKNGLTNRLLHKIFVSEKKHLRKGDFRNGVSLIAACSKG